MDYPPHTSDTIIKSEPDYGGGESAPGGSLAYFFSPLLDISGQFQAALGHSDMSPTNNDSSDVDTGPGLFPFFSLSGVSSGDDMSVDISALDGSSAAAIPMPLGPPRHAPQFGFTNVRAKIPTTLIL